MVLSGIYIMEGEILYGSKKKKQKLGCLIKDFRHDGGGGRQP